uniref:G-protein coupled receptors family 1 profile domain-containing protein n=1 Tax=Plectus sambesii TaxID=2011161 RepID=A0A914W949_9BILA
MIEGADVAAYALSVLYSSLAVFGLLGNLWVLVTVSSQLFHYGGSKKLYTNGLISSNGLTIGYSGVLGRGGRSSFKSHQASAYIYLLVLSVVDLLSVFPVPLLITDIIRNEWPFGLPLCKLLFVCEGMNKSLSPLILTALSVDRYVAVCKPTLFWMRETGFACIVLTICFGIAALFIAPVTFYAEVVPMPDSNFKEHDKCSLHFINMRIYKYFDLAQTVCCYLTPLVLICFVYAAILLKLWNHTRYSAVGRRTTISLSRVVRCSVMVVAFYFICWTPYWTMRLKSSMRDYFDSSNSSNSSDSVASELVQTKNCTHDQMESGEPCDEAKALEMPGGWTVFIMYMVHSLPYAQSAFNWLFYAFLNRHLRQASRPASRATAPTFDNASRDTSYCTSLLHNLQTVGSHLRAASLDTGHLFMRHSPFRYRSRMKSRYGRRPRAFTVPAFLAPVPTNPSGSRSSTCLRDQLAFLTPDRIAVPFRAASDNCARSVYPNDFVDQQLSSSSSADLIAEAHSEPLLYQSHKKSATLPDRLASAPTSPTLRGGAATTRGRKNSIPYVHGRTDWKQAACANGNGLNGPVKMVLDLWRRNSLPTNSQTGTPTVEWL